MSTVADPTDVVGRRVVASLIDGVLVVGPSVAILTSSFEYLEEEDLAAIGYLDADEYCDDYLEQFENDVCVAVGDEAWFSDAGAGFFGLGLILTILVYVVLQGLTGWTVGKLVTGIRTVREDGGRPGIGRAFVRWVLWLVDGLPFLALVGFITALTTNGHRRVGDMVAKTFVVRASAAGRPVLVGGVTAPPAPPPPGTAAAPPPPSPAAPAAPVPTTAPQWDEARGTYIQWDPQASAWMQWDEQARRWDPIPGQASAAPPPPPPPAPPGPTSPPPPPT
jgi:hypothetical protein